MCQQCHKEDSRHIGWMGAIMAFMALLMLGLRNGWVDWVFNLFGI